MREQVRRRLLEIAAAAKIRAAGRARRQPPAKSSVAAPGGRVRRRAAAQRAAHNARQARPARSALRPGRRRPAARPSVASISSRETAPGRSRRGPPPRQATTVDSTPQAQGPPSRIRPIRSPRSASTCSARVGLTAPERLAEGAASGAPAAAISARAISEPGTRTASVSSPARASRLMRQSAATGATSVSGPGPEAGGEPLGARVEPRLARGGRDAVEMGDQRIEGRAALDRVDLRPPRRRTSQVRRGRRPSRSACRRARRRAKSPPLRRPRRVGGARRAQTSGQAVH